MLCKHLQQQELLRCKDCGGGEAEGTDRYLLTPCALASYDTAMIDPSLSLKILSSSGSKVLKSPKGLYCSHSLPVNPSDAIVPACLSTLLMQSSHFQNCSRFMHAIRGVKPATCITAEGNPLICGKRLTST